MSEKQPNHESKMGFFADRFVLSEAVTDPEAGLSLPQREEELSRIIRNTIKRSGSRYKHPPRGYRTGETVYTNSDDNQKPFELIIELLPDGSTSIYKPWLNYTDTALYFTIGGQKPSTVYYGRPAPDGEDTEYAKNTVMDERLFMKLIGLVQNSHLVDRHEL